MQLDAAAMNWVAAHRRPVLTRVFRAVSLTGEGRTWFVVGLARWLHRPHLRDRRRTTRPRAAPCQACTAHAAQAENGPPPAWGPGSSNAPQARAYATYRLRQAGRDDLVQRWFPDACTR